jgi:acetyltransferase-like isoleucine patch superfamily enzyme
MIKKIFDIIFYRYYYPIILRIIENEQRNKPKYKIHGDLNNLIIGNNVSIRDNAEFECQKGKITIGDDCFILQDSKILSYGGYIKIGNNVSINPFCILYGHGGLTIGNNVRIANSSIFIPSNHNFDRTDIPIWHQGETSKGIVLEDDIWIGSNVKVLDNVKISKGIIVGAGSVVTKSLDKEYGVYAGVPAKFIKYRYE